MIKVVCGIIYNSGKIFIAKRKPGKSLAGYWEFPGGKVEAEEEYPDTLTRELEEELGMKVNVLNYLCTNIHHYDTFQIELIAFKCEFLSASFKMTDHDVYEWINPEEILTWNLAPADIPIAQLVSK